jgi:carbon monoxide dehydrogenase subunit G
MELTNEFEVDLSPSEAWKILTDVERIAPCLPGAQLEEVAGDEYRGSVKVKVGPITASYKGTARFTERDEGAGKAVLKAEGRETRGQGNASATITATLTGSGPGSTKVAVSTDLNITGKVAQFGRGVLADVSAKLIAQFVSNLEASIAAEEQPTAASEAAPSGEAAAPAPAAKAAKARRKATTAPRSEEPEVAAPSEVPFEEPRRLEARAAAPVDLVQLAGPSLARRLAPYASIAGAAFLLRIVIYAFRRRRK